MQSAKNQNLWIALTIWTLLFSAGCCCSGLPAIDPSGDRFFLPAGNTTSWLSSGSQGQGGCCLGLSCFKSGGGSQGSGCCLGLDCLSAPFTNKQNSGGCCLGMNCLTAPFAGTNETANGGMGLFNSQILPPVQPAFTQPSEPAPCCGQCGKKGCFGGCSLSQVGHKKEHLIPSPHGHKTRGQTGEIIMTPSRIIAPVGSEVVVLAGICGGDGFYVMNQPLEWMLSNDSVGQFIEVGGMHHPNFNRMVPPSAKKFDGQYAHGRTGLKERVLTRGTPTPADDIYALKGQAYTSLSSASPGTSYVTCLAPKAEAWDKRRASTVIHWVDGVWAIPMPAFAAAGTVYPLTTAITKSSDGGGVPDWKVRYSIIGGAPAEFAPTGSQTAEVVTSDNGKATVQLRQVAGKFDPGTTQVRVEVVRPSVFGEAELIVESGVTTVTWSAPALTIRAIGPKSAGVEEAFNYRIEISNPGDQVTRGVILRTRDFSQDLEFVSSDPKPAQYGKNFEWRLGDVTPGAQSRIVNIQLKSKQRGNAELCFEVSSDTDQLKTEACAQTAIAAPCVGLEVEGPTTAKVGEQIEFEIKIGNQCDQVLNNVRVEVQYDTGLDATGVGNPIGLDLGTLDFNQNKSIPLLFDVLQPGTRCFNLSITADGGHTARQRRCVEAVLDSIPQVEMKLEGQPTAEEGQKPLFRATITNTGNLPLADLQLNSRMSDSLEPIQVTKLFPHKWMGQDLFMQIGRLDPGESAVVEIVMMAKTVDPNAFMEMTISSPSLQSLTRRFSMRIEPPGTLGPLPPALLPPTDAGGKRGDSIQIPGQSGNFGARKTLEVEVATFDKSIAVNGRGRIEFSVKNNSAAEEQNIDITALVPPGLKLLNLTDIDGNPVAAKSNRDGTQFFLDRRNEMRAGESIEFSALVSGQQAGNYTFEVTAISQSSVGVVSAADQIKVTQ